MAEILYLRSQKILNMNIRLIIFDFDGTLGDTRRNIVMTLQQTMQVMHLPVMYEARCAATIGLTLKMCCHLPSHLRGQQEKNGAPVVSTCRRDAG